MYFCEFFISHANHPVTLGSNSNSKAIIETLPRIYPRFSKCVRVTNLTTTLLTVLKNVSMESCTLWCLSEHKKVELLVPMLERTGYSCDYVSRRRNIIQATRFIVSQSSSLSNRDVILKLLLPSYIKSSSLSSECHRLGFFC